MVKGLSRKVIIVKSPDPKVFEQAIFIVKDDYLLNGEIDRKELMRQANEAAGNYVNKVYKHKGYTLKKAFLYSLLGALLVSSILAIGYWVIL